MIRIGIIETSGYMEMDLNNLSRLPEGVKQKIEKTKNEGERALRAGAYCLLDKMYCDVFCALQMPEIIYTPHGKPHFNSSIDVNSSCRFNISHDKEVSVVAISDGCDVGVDVQLRSVRENVAERIGTRFHDALSATDARSEDVAIDSFSCFKFKDGEIVEAFDSEIVIAEIAKKDTEDSVLAKWTVLEAILKLDGGGFSSMREINNLAADSSVKTFILKIGSEEYLISVAVKNK